MDPWSSGGVLETINPSLEAVVIENGAHHLGITIFVILAKINDRKNSNCAKFWFETFRYSLADFSIIFFDKTWEHQT